MVVKGSQMQYENGKKLLSRGGQLMMVEVPVSKMENDPVLHSHPHEQVSYIVSGKFKVFFGNDAQVLQKGDSIYLEPNQLHGVRSLEDGSVILDVFTPQRQDFLNS